MQRLLVFPKIFIYWFCHIAIRISERQNLATPFFVQLHAALVLRQPLHLHFGDHADAYIQSDVQPYIHTFTADGGVHRTQGDSQLVRSNKGEVLCSGTPRHSSHSALPPFCLFLRRSARENLQSGLQSAPSLRVAISPACPDRCSTGEDVESSPRMPGKSSGVL